jgi:hypothetical protein
MTETVIGTTPAGNKDRVLEVWLLQSDGDDQLHLWIHAPNAGSSDGWEICVRPQDLLAAIQKLGIH